MSIYISQGYETKALRKIESEQDDFDTLVNSKISTYVDVSSLDLIKRTQSYYFIAGELSRPVRSNDTLIKKTLLAIDYDGLDMTEKDFERHLKKTIGILNYYAYPSIRNGLAGTRYRLLIRTDRPFSQEENKPLIEFVTDQIGLPYDKASDTWSQLMGLKCTFESESIYEGKCIYNDGIGILKVDNAIQKMAERKPKRTERNKPFMTVNYTRKKTYTAKFLEEIVTGAGEGERNQFITSKLGKLFSLGMEAEKAYELIHAINQNFISPPLEDSEVNKTFESILKADTKKMSKGGID